MARAIRTMAHNTAAAWMASKNVNHRKGQKHNPQQRCAERQGQHEPSKNLVLHKRDFDLEPMNMELNSEGLCC